MTEEDEVRARLLAVYDHDLRGEREIISATRSTRHGPLIWAHYLGGRGFVSYSPLPAGTDLEPLVAATAEHYRSDPEVVEVEWKSRGHDPLPDLAAVLGAYGFVAEEAESVMLGEATALAADVDVLPTGVTIRQVHEPDDVRAMCAMQDEVFGTRPDARMTEELLHRLSLGRDDMELWIAETKTETETVIVSAGRLEPVDDSVVAGIWGGCTRPDWRGRGIYRALTAERARSALRRGRTLIHSDSTEGSRPILERSGFLKVTTTTPYVWHRTPPPRVD